MQALSRALLALSISYDCVFFLFELEDGLLQPILRSSTNLQGLARAAAVKLQLLTCFSAANTQVGVMCLYVFVVFFLQCCFQPVALTAFWLGMHHQVS